MSFFLGDPARWEQKSQLAPDQLGLQSQLVQAGMFPGAGGAFGEAADYYRGLLGGQGFDEMAAPELRRFQEETIPGIAEQFAGLGSGGTFGSSFRNTMSSAGAGLAERLAAMRQGLRSQGATGLMGIGRMGLTPHMENVLMQRRPGFLEQMAPFAGAALGAFGGPYLGSLGS